MDEKRNCVTKLNFILHSRSPTTYAFNLAFLLSSQGTVILLFQPAEEAGNGAKRMIQDGALEDVEAIFAVHVSHEHPTGIIGSRPGPLLAGCGFFRAVISGKRASATNPHNSDDPVLAASAAVISIQGIVSRESNPLDSQVLPRCHIYLSTNYQSCILLWSCLLNFPN